MATVDILTENVHGGSFWMINAQEMQYVDEFYGDHLVLMPIWYKYGHC